MTKDKELDDIVVAFEVIVSNLEEISDLARNIIYVSCNPITLARDLKLITKDEKYKVIKVCPVDMFPQTYHIETVCLMSRGEGK